MTELSDGLLKTVWRYFSFQ